jgi:hypothetical protein
LQDFAVMLLRQRLMSQMRLLRLLLNQMRLLLRLLTS